MRGPASRNRAACESCSARYQATQPPICLYQVSKYPRKDAFEVYVMLKEKERLFAREVVFSRHRCHRWPEDQVVLERIQTHVSHHMELHHSELAEKQQAKP